MGANGSIHCGVIRSTRASSLASIAHNRYIALAYRFLRNASTHVLTAGHAPARLRAVKRSRKSRLNLAEGAPCNSNPPAPPDMGH